MGGRGKLSWAIPLGSGCGGGSLDKNDLKCGKFKDLSRGCGTWDGSHKTDPRRTRNCQEGIGSREQDREW